MTTDDKLGIRLRVARAVIDRLYRYRNGTMNMMQFENWDRIDGMRVFVLEWKHKIGVYK